MDGCTVTQNHVLEKCPSLLSWFFFFFQLEDNGFTMLRWYLPYINRNWPQVYICPHPS